MNTILRFLFKRYETKFQDMFVESLIGYIPKDVHEPAVDFLRNGSEKLEKWLLYQSYYLNRKAINDLKNSERYQGMLTNIKVLLLLSAKKKVKQTEELKKKEEKNFLDGVEKFKTLGKKDK